MTEPNHDQAFSESAQTLRWVKFSALGVSALMVAGIVGLMILSAGKGEDITGIVAPAGLVALVSGGIAVVAAVMGKRGRKGR